MEFYTFILEDPCVTIQRFMPNGTSAWACGMARFIDIFVVTTSVSIMAYFQHVVYSHCEDLAQCGGGPELKDLVLNRDSYRKSQHSPYASFEGLAESGEIGSIGFLPRPE